MSKHTTAVAEASRLRHPSTYGQADHTYSARTFGTADLRGTIRPPMAVYGLSGTYNVPAMARATVNAPTAREAVTTVSRHPSLSVALIAYFNAKGTR